MIKLPSTLLKDKKVLKQATLSLPKQLLDSNIEAAAEEAADTIDIKYFINQQINKN